MAIFGRKKQQTVPTKISTVNADDIWGTSSNSVKIKESKYDDAKLEEVGPEAIDLDILAKKMEILEKEIQEKESQPVLTHEDFTTNPVKQSEVDQAQEEYEAQYKIDHQRYLDTHIQDIKSCNDDNVEQKIEDMVDKEEKMIQDIKSKNYGIEQVGEDEVSLGLAQLNDPKDVTKDKDFKNIQSVSDEMLSKANEYIKRHLDTQVTIDNLGDIESIEISEQETQEILNKYKKNN